jgi:hypothetical protein
MRTPGSLGLGAFGAALLCAASTLASAQTSAPAPTTFAGVWALDAARKSRLDVYGEVRLVEASETEIRLTMVDYGSAWVAGAFRGVVRLVPWTFTFGRWAPRRGGEESRQPLARARSAEPGLVLAKRTVYGNGDFVWVWTVDGEGNQLVHHETDQPWSADFTARPPEGNRSYFLRASPSDSAAASSLAARLAQLAGSIPVVDEIHVRLSADLQTLLVSCPMQDCRIVELESGRQVGSRPLPRGTIARVPIHTEGIVQPEP